MSSRNWCGRIGVSRCMQHDTELTTCICKRLPSSRVVSGQWYGLQSHESPHLINRDALQWTIKVIWLQAGCNKPAMHRSLDYCRVLSYCILLATGTTVTFTPHSRVLLEKLPVSQLVNKFLSFYGNQRFITAITNARHLSLSWASSIQSIPSHTTSWSSILIFPLIYAWVFQVVSFPQVFPPKQRTLLCSTPFVPHAPPISFFSIWPPGYLWWAVQIITFLVM